jgi:hypothetical protein
MAPACSGDRGGGEEPETAGCGSRDGAGGGTADGGEATVDTYVFGCPECGQEIEVDASMRAAILANGCPVCTEPAATECFEADGE